MVDRHFYWPPTSLVISGMQRGLHSDAARPPEALKWTGSAGPGSHGWGGPASTQQPLWRRGLCSAAPVSLACTPVECPRVVPREHMPRARPAASQVAQTGLPLPLPLPGEDRGCWRAHCALQEASLVPSRGRSAPDALAPPLGGWVWLGHASALCLLRL